MRIGVGIGYRREIKEQVLEYKSHIDWLEFYPDHYIENNNLFYELEELSQHFRLAPHSLSLSVGSETGVDMEYLNSIHSMALKLNSPWISDHLCYTNIDGVDLGHLTPMERTEENLSLVIENIKKVKTNINIPFLIENITNGFEFPTNKISEGEFLKRVLVESDCGLLLDLANVFINSKNFKFDPYNFLDSIPLERVVEIHLAGGVNHNGIWIDTHSERINEEIWDLLQYTLKRCEVKGILLELDSKFPENFSEVIEELDRARNLLVS